MSTIKNVLWEEVWKRTPNTKHYHLSDGSKKVVIFNDQVHYEDENGNFQNIDTDLHDEADFDSWDFPVAKEGKEIFHEAKERAKADKKANKLNRDNFDFQGLKVPFEVKIPRVFKRGYTIGKGKDKLTFKPVKCSPAKGYVRDNDKSIIDYQDVWNDVDVSLQLTKSGIKETLILKTDKAPTTFSFEVIGDIENLTELKLQEPWLKDANGEQRDVQQVIRTENNKTYLDLIVDTSNLVYPIEIDPSVKLTSTLIHGYVRNDIPNNSNIGSQVGIKGGSSIYRGFSKFDLSSIPASAYVTSATYKAYAGWGSGEITIVVQRCLSSPTASTTWNTQPSTDGIGWASMHDSQHYDGDLWTFNVTALVRAWVDGTYENHGFCFRSSNESYSSYRMFYDGGSLSVTYDEKPSAPTLTSPNGGETWNASHEITWNASTDPDTAQSSLQYNIELSIDNGANWDYTIVGLTTAGATSYTYDFSAIPETSTALIRIRAYDGASYGPWDESDGVFTIQHNKAPTAPTDLSPDGGEAQDRAQAIRLSWQHNDADGDPQSKFDLSYSTDNWATQTDVTQVTTNQYYDIPAGTLSKGNVQWKVRTYDQADLSSPYSSQAIFYAGDKPATPTITSPAGGATVAVANPTVQWSSSGQTSYQLQVEDSLAVTVYDSGEVVSTNKAQTISSYDLANGETYTIKLRVKNSDGLWSDWDSVGINVSYTPPPTPTLTLTGQEGYIKISITNPAPEGTEPSVSSNSLYRRISGETTWIRIAKDISNSGSYSDYAVASGVTYQYKVRAIGDNGTYSDSATGSTSISLTGVWLHDVTDPANTVRRFQYDGDGRSFDWATDSTFMKFAGRTKRVAELGETDEDNIRVNLLLNDEADFAALDSLVRSKNTICYRDGRGRKHFGVVDHLPVSDQTFGYKAIVDVYETDYEEEV